MREPVFISVRPDGRTVRYRKVGRRWEPTRSNPIEVEAKITGTDLLLIAGGVVTLGVVGYFIWAAQANAAANASATVEGTDETTTDPFTSQQGQFVNASGQSLGPVANTSGIDFSQLQPVTPTAPALSPLLSRGQPPPLPTGF
jgi:hypothetical protein